MAEQEAERRRPYGATANVVGVIQRARTRNLPEKIDDDFYRIVGIPDVVFGRVAESLKFLGFVNADNTPTELFKAMSAAPEQDYRRLLEGAVRNAYSEDFQRVDPSQDLQGQIVDAFKPYEPRSQTSRMVMLFLGLCREAGIPVLDAPRQRQMTGTSGRQSRPRTASAKAPAPRPTAGVTAHVTATAVGVVMGVTESDIAALDDEDFDEVWNALGKVARARARMSQAREQIEPESDS